MKPDFPHIADELAEPRPDMNIKVAAFTVSEKSSNTFWVFEISCKFAGAVPYVGTIRC